MTDRLHSPPRPAPARPQHAARGGSPRGPRWRRAAALALLALGAASCIQGQTAAAESTPAHSNRLLHASSPYLLLHAHNPVDWYPWGEEAFAKARAEHKPIFVSIGYSTCYWCHVAERTIYSDPAIAALMNQWFVNIKVDREQRPDVDAVYMIASQVLTGRGGWPNNVFLTPELKPFFAGSYFPPNDAPGRGPGFPTLLKGLNQAWHERRADIERVAAQVDQAMQTASQRGAAAAVAIDREALFANARTTLAQEFDAAHAGFGDPGGTKFPQAPVLELLLADYRAHHASDSLRMLGAQLDAMALGGIRDQLDGGFHRYSTEPTWSIPHFEKMLYDNAQLLRLYSEAYALTGNALYRRVAEGVTDYVRREMSDPAGGFYTAQDAEVEGREGAQYLWRREQIEGALGATDAARLFARYRLTPLPPSALGPQADAEPNGGVLRLAPQANAAALVPELDALAPLRARLLAVRQQRPQAARDDKIVVALNALMIRGLIASGRALHRDQDLALASAAAERLWRDAFDPRSGALQHQIFRGRADTPAYADDYALFAGALLDLAAASVGDAVRWRERARRLADALLQRFVHGADLALSQSADLPIHPLELGDTTQPSTASATLDLLWRLGETAAGERYREAAARLLPRLSAALTQNPSAWGSLLSSLGTHPDAATTAATASLDSAAQVQAHAIGAARADYDEVRVALDIAPGYHLNANPATLDYLIPTRLGFADIAPLQVDYPPAQSFAPAFAHTALAVYQGRVAIVARLPRGALATLAATRVTLQACTAQICLPPATFEVPIQRDPDTPR